MSSPSKEPSAKAHRTMLKWAQVESHLADLRNQRTDLLERDDQNPNLECGEWYYDQKEEVAKDVFVPTQLVGLYTFTAVWVLINFAFWTACCFFVPVLGMHAIQRYVTSDMRVHFVIYWLIQPFYLGSYVFTLGKITLDRTRQSIILSIVNIAWHIVHIALTYTIPSQRQRIFPIASTAMYYTELSINVIVSASSIVLAMNLNELIKMIEASKQQVTAQIVKGIDVKYDDSGIGIVDQSGNNQDIPEEDAEQYDLEDNDQNETLPKVKLNDTVVSGPEDGFRLERAQQLQQQQPILHKSDSMDSEGAPQKQFNERLDLARDGETNEYRKMKTIIKQDDNKKKRWGRAVVASNYSSNPTAELEMVKHERDITKLMGQQQ